jgi:hypothetical protein
VPAAAGVALVSRSAALTPLITALTPNNGSALGGDVVTLRGSGFPTSPANVSVVLNGMPCAVLSASPDTVTCRTGARTAVEPVSVAVTVDGAGRAVFDASAVFFRYLDRWSALTTWLNQEPPVAGDTDPRTPTVGQNPLAFASSLQMALAFQVVLFAIAWVQQAVGTTGVLLSATLLGLTDVDALTMSMTRYGADPTHVRVAAAAIGIGVLSNTMLKLALVVSIGGPRFRARAAAGLLMLAAAAAVGIWIGWP